MEGLFIIPAIIITIFLAYKFNNFMNKKSHISNSLYLNKVKRENKVYNDCEDINRFVHAQIEFDEKDKLECSEANIIIINIKIAELIKLSNSRKIQCDDYYEGDYERRRKSSKHKIRR